MLDVVCPHRQGDRLSNVKIVAGDAGCVGSPWCGWYLMVIRYKALSNAIVHRYKLSSLVRKNIGDSEMELIHTMKVRRGAQVSDVDGVRCRLADDTRVMSETSYTSIGNYNEISLINAYD